MLGYKGARRGAAKEQLRAAGEGMVTLNATLAPNEAANESVPFSCSLVLHVLFLNDKVKRWIHRWKFSFNKLQSLD